MRIAIVFPDFRTIIVPMNTERDADNLIFGKLGESKGFPIGSYSWKKEEVTTQTDLYWRNRLVNRIYTLTELQGFGMYWPQEICEDCGIPCFGEEYA